MQYLIPYLYVFSSSAKLQYKGNPGSDNSTGTHVTRLMAH